MRKRWLLYILTLAGALVLRVSYTGWFAGVVLAWVLCLPPLALLTALPRALSCKLVILPEAEEVLRRSGGAWKLWAECGRAVTPVGMVHVTIDTVNALTGETETMEETWFVSGDGGTKVLPVSTAHCGLLTGKLTSAWCADGLGLFRIPLRRSAPGEMWVLPMEGAHALPELPDEPVTGYRPRLDGGPGEDYDPRDYRPGDRLSTIHWKLTAKKDELITRETLETVRPMPLITIDLFGRSGALDQRLEQLADLTAAILDRDWTFKIGWADPYTGNYQQHDIADGSAWRGCLKVLLSQRAPLEGRSVIDLDDVDPIIHLGKEDERE